MLFGSQSGRPLRTVVLMTFLLVTLNFAASAGDGKVEGVSYTLIPTVEALRWNSEMGLKDTELYGGRLGINFGQFLSLQGYYLGRNGVGTDLGNSGLLDGAGDPLLDQELEIRSVGADVLLNLKRGGLVPFVKLGAGVLEVHAADGDDSNEIGLRLGGGLRFGSERYRFMAYMEDAAFRSNRYALAAGAVASPLLEDPSATKMRHNLAFGAGLDLKLGGQRHTGLTQTDRALMERYRSGLGGVSWPLEPFYERITFADVVDLPAQDFIGFRTGLDFGSFVGLRGWFAKGVNSAFDDTSPIQTFGGELFLNLNSGQGAIPYLIAGVGKLDFRSAYRDNQGQVRDDETMLTLGGGLAFTVSDRVRLDLSLRDHILSQADLEATTSTDQLTHNWGWSAGVRMALGGGRSLLSPAKPNTEPFVFLEEETVAPTTVAVETAPEIAPETVAPTTVAVETAPVEEQEEVQETVTAPETAPAVPAATVVENFHGERSITIPLPTQGEIYLRYGNPGGVNVTSNFERREDLTQPMAPAGGEAAAARVETPAAPIPTAGAVAEPQTSADTEAAVSVAPSAIDLEGLRQLLREELDHERQLRDEEEAAKAAAVEQTLPVAPVQEEAAVTVPAPAGGLTEEQQLDLLELKLADRIDARIETRARELAAGMVQAPAAAQPSTIVVESAGANGSDGAGEHHWSPNGFDTFLGATVDNPEQFLIGGRLDLGPLSYGSSVHFAPELSLGFGGGATSYMMAGNFIRHFGNTEEPGTWAPFLGVGVGFLGFSDEVGGRSKREGVLNLSYGVTVHRGDTTIFAEHQGIDLFDVNRILVGLRWPLGR